jgi:hypothetical protein
VRQIKWRKLCHYICETAEGLFDGHRRRGADPGCPQYGGHARSSRVGNSAHHLAVLTSYGVGFESDWLDRRLRMNLAATPACTAEQQSTTA